VVTTTCFCAGGASGAAEALRPDAASFLVRSVSLALVVAEGTGRRISAWRTLVWDDIDFETGTIRWCPETVIP
jgi:integrase